MPRTHATLRMRPRSMIGAPYEDCLAFGDPRAEVTLETHLPFTKKLLVLRCHQRATMRLVCSHRRSRYNARCLCSPQCIDITVPSMTAWQPDVVDDPTGESASVWQDPAFLDALGGILAYAVLYGYIITQTP